MDDAIEDGIGYGRLADDVVPSIDWDLAGDEDCATAVALLDDLEQVTSLLGLEGFQPSIVEVEQPHLAEPLHQLSMATVAAWSC